MSRRAYNVQRALSDLVLDVPLYSYAQEHIMDRCGHALVNPLVSTIAGGNDMGGGITGVSLMGRLRWEIEPITDGCFSLSFFMANAYARGHGWCWEGTLGDYVETGVSAFSCATSWGGEARRFHAGNIWNPLEYFYSDGLHFVTVTVDGQHIACYFDGALIGTTDGYQLIGFDRFGMRGVDSDVSNGSDGTFRQFKLFRRTLTADEVATLYAEEQKYLTAV